MALAQTHPVEPSFRDSVDIMFNRAVALMDLSPGLEEKIRVCNATYRHSPSGLPSVVKIA